jgi:hypothetical protein
MIRSRVIAGIDRERAEGKKTLGRPKVGSKLGQAIHQQITGGNRILEVVKVLGSGNHAEGEEEDDCKLRASERYCDKPYLRFLRKGTDQ